MTEFDCPMNDNIVTLDNCKSCGYFTLSKICGFVIDCVNPTRGNGKGLELYKTPLCKICFTRVERAVAQSKRGLCVNCFIREEPKNEPRQK